MAGPPASSCMLSGGWDSSKRLSELLTFGKWEPFQALGTVSTWREGMQTGLGRQGQEQSDLSLSTTAFLITPCIVSQHQAVTQTEICRDRLCNHRSCWSPILPQKQGPRTLINNPAGMLKPGPGSW